jgi:uncharacterized protein
VRITLNQFQPNRSFLINEELQPADLDIDIGIMRFPTPLEVSVEAWKDADDLTVNVHVEGERKLSCSRCLEEMNNPFEKDFTLHYDIKGLEYVDIDQDVRDELILEHPIQALCRKDCRGLCPGCGVNLNVQQCRCGTSPAKENKK